MIFQFCKRPAWRAIFCALVLVATTPVKAVQPTARNSPASGVHDIDATPALDVAAIRARIETLTTRTDLAVTERDLVLEQLRAAVARAEAAASARQEAGDYAASLQAAPKTIAALGAESALPQSADTVPENADPITLQLRLAALQAEAVALRSKQRSLTQAVRSMATRPAEARAELADLRKQLDQAQASNPSSTSSLLAEAIRLRAEAARQELSARIEKTEQELLSMPTRESIASAQLDLLARRIAAVDIAIEALNVRSAAQRQQQAALEESQAREFAQRLAGQPVAVREYASENTVLRSTQSQLSERLGVALRKQEELQSLLYGVDEARKSADQILAIGAISDASAEMLRGLQKNLVSGARIEQRIAGRNNEIVDQRVQRFQNQQALRALQQTKVAEGFLAENKIAPTDAGIALMSQLVERRSAALTDLDDVQGKLIAALSENNARDADLLQRSAQLRLLLGERLLWLPSAGALGADWLQQLGTGVAWLVKPSKWTAIPKAAASTWRKQPLFSLFLLTAVVLLFFIRRRLAASLQKFAQPVGHRQDSFGITLLAWAATVLLALAWPLAIGSVGWSLRATPTGGFAQMLGAGLINLAILWFMLGLFIDMCRRQGVFVAHFGWEEKGTRRLSRALRLLLLVLAPAAVLTGMTDSSGDPALIDGIGRLGFMFGSLGLAVFLYRVFRPHGGALTGAAAREGWIGRTRKVWSRGLVAIPLLLAVIAAMGYYATARQLQSGLFASGWLMLVVLILYNVAMRGVLVASRRAAYQQADAQHAKYLAEAHAANAGDTGDGSEALALQNQEPEIDAVTVSKQTLALLRAASGVALAMLLLGIWRETIPALNVFNNVVLWSHVVSGAGAADTVAAVTLGHVMTSLMALVLTVIAARNLPGFIEIVLLQRFQIDTGTRYAISTIARYVILAVGFIVAINGLGADWSKLQWIVAALGVGLGFGLQEIVANFVSGLIILFERPVRVGDLVTIGTTSGTVTRIKIRAITITDFDNFEVLVPNKMFITETVQNWTLTSAVTRVTLKVGIAYGSNVEQAQKLMLGVAAANAQVLTSPAPSVLFVGLGESALQFEIRAYVGKVDQRPPTTTELYKGLLAALTNAGIEIPFPQRDINVRNLDQIVAPVPVSTAAPMEPLKPSAATPAA